MKQLKCSSILCSLPTKPRPQVSSSNCSIIWQFSCTLYVIFHIYIEWIIVMIIALQKSSFLFLSFKEVVYREVKLRVDVKRKREFAPRDQVSPLLVVFSSLFLFTQFSSIRIALNRFYLLIFCFGKFSTWRLPFTWSLNSLIKPGYQNGPFYSCGLGVLAFEWTWGWGWPCQFWYKPHSFSNVNFA